MLQNRPAPAYQEYASSMLANYNFRALDLKARGALYTLRLECWVNKRLPSDLDTLSKALGLAKEELASLLPEVSEFFVFKDGFLYSKELEDYRAYLDAVRLARSQGGKKGAAITNAKNKEPLTTKQDTRQLARDSLDKVSQAQDSKTQINSVTNKEMLDDPWLKAFDGEP